MMLLLICAIVFTFFGSACADFVGVFDAQTFSASTLSQQMLGNALVSFFNWNDAQSPIFSRFEALSSSTATRIAIAFQLGSTDAAVNRVMQQHDAQIAAYIQSDVNCTSLKSSLENRNIALYQLSEESIASPAPSDGNPSFLNQYYPELIVGGVTLIFVVSAIIAFQYFRRRSAADEQLYDTMEAMLQAEEAAGRPRKQPVNGAASPPTETAANQTRESSIEQQNTPKSEAVPPAPRPQQSV